MTDRDPAVSFTRWASGRQQALLRTAVLLCGDHHRAEDLVQDALTKVAVRWSRLEDQNPDAYARRVMVRTNISWWRKQRREVVLGVCEGGAAVAGPGAAVDRKLLLDRALAQLTPRQRATVVLRFYDDLSERDTAEALGVAVGTVKSQTHLALARLREAAPELAELLEDTT
jgi:RNA polymerase sigma-70 factor (sigma-E family)